MQEQAVGQREQRAVVVGAGPNGLTAAALLARAGWQVDVFERSARPGGAAASSDALGAGTIVDLGAAAHPFGVASPVFRSLDLAGHGLEWVHSPLPLAHPLAGRPAAVLQRDLDATAEELGADGQAWRRIHAPLTRHLDQHLRNLLAPLLRVPPHPLRLAGFAPVALPPAAAIASLAFRQEPARALFLGSAAHAVAPLGQPFTGAFGALFGALGMTGGWPVARGGSGAIMRALVAAVQAHGGRIHTGHEVNDLRELPPAEAVLLDLTPAQVLRLRGPQIEQLPGPTRRRLAGWRYGAAAHKVDFLLSEPIPWRDPRVAEATTVHVIGSSAELLRAEAEVARGRMPERPFVLLCQQQTADPSRAGGRLPGMTVVWAYAHVPHGYVEPRPGLVTERIEQQLERFAPGFRELVVERRITTPAQLEGWNPNLVGGDIAGGSMTGLQSLLRPGLTLHPHRLGRPGLYLCSSSTPPGAGVHGMPGAWAAQAAIADAERHR